ncbi:MAG: Protein phosphatase methylesterase 1 [Phylliscum demangeonii]|nr:MAG: Protein phosphatase methylesterase 1 [Phylliscum demangeonii]
MYITPPGPKGPTFVAHHGAGSSGLSFAVLAAEIRKLMPDAGFLSLDARSHGETMTATVGSPGLDLSLDSLTNDMIYAIRVLGGAVMTNVAKSGVFGDQVLGYAVLDVVEGSSSRHAEIIFYSQLTDRIGSAIDALQSMQTYLSTRPPGFESVSAGIEWHVQSRTIRNPTSASVSVPGLLRENHASHLPSDAWTWSTDLLATQPYWENWFVGLSKNFLEARGGKLLILAGTDRLDKELIIGQMQGKYQLLVFPETGHFIHEDAPAKTAQALVDFYKRNDRSALVLPPKVSELLKQKAMQEKS